MFIPQQQELTVRINDDIKLCISSSSCEFNENSKDKKKNKNSKRKSKSSSVRRIELSEGKNVVETKTKIS